MGKDMEHIERQKERGCSATCMVCGGGEEGGQRKGRMRRADAKKGGGGGGKKGADATRGCKERSGCGARVEEKAWRCGDDD